ncbi:hypothetical protein Q1W71_06935 [Flavobacterium pectinovorum]|uniref:hypothetical protein n=1 Tax=Flavobacterium pectinovorum TaxID=29533 RepID=UPI00265E91DD|nr:hypothetical protein [Flavobacterium pectinovorum]WKL49519.1 hypothetical protein Q1W71_06935 [Flavobacterium pectinovorum]
MKKVITLIAIAVIICSFGLRGKISGEKFDSEKWKTADLNSEDNFSLRWDMMNSLRNNNSLIGMSKSKIITLLGKPDEGFTTENTFRYYLGYTDTGINTGSLIVTFDNGIVSGISVWQG